MRPFSGSHYEVGRQIGAYYALHGVEFSPVTSPTILRDQLSYYEKFAPEILEELHGIATGGSFSFDKLAHECLVTEILFFNQQPAKSCSIGGFTDCNGRAWVARNYDWHPLTAEHFQTWEFAFPEGKVVAISDMCIGSASDLDKKEQRFVYEDAINSHGLYIGMTYAHCAATKTGLSTSDIIKLISWRCKTVEDALDLFASVQLSCPKNYFLADAARRMAVVEHAVLDMHIRRPDENGVLILTNHYAKHLNAFDLVTRENTTFDRYDRLGDELRRLSQSQPTIDFVTLDGIMSDPGSPVCQFWPKLEIETVWTLLLELNLRNYRLISNPRSAQRVVTDFTVR